jgi:hypothetical protein
MSDIRRTLNTASCPVANIIGIPAVQWCEQQIEVSLMEFDKR